jgi:hypothetical protein
VTDIDHSALARIDRGSPAAIADAMRAIDRMEEALHKAETFDDVRVIQKAADAYRSIYRHYKEVADRAGEVRITADVIIGKRLAELPKARGAQPTGSKQMIRPADDAPTYAEWGIPNRMHVTATACRGDFGFGTQSGNRRAQSRSNRAG